MCILLKNTLIEYIIYDFDAIKTNKCITNANEEIMSEKKIQEPFFSSLAWPLWFVENS